MRECKTIRASMTRQPLTDDAEENWTADGVRAEPMRALAALLESSGGENTTSQHHKGVVLRGADAARMEKAHSRVSHSRRLAQLPGESSRSAEENNAALQFLLLV